MQLKSRLDTFISSTNYTRPVDIKKLKFIYSAINRYTSIKNRDIKNLSILEVGYGKGGIVFPLASLGCQVRAFDINEKAVDYIQTQINQNKIKNLTVSVDDGYTFDDGKTYDAVITSEVFEHVLEPSKLATNITRRMTEGSYLIVTIPNGYGPWELRNRVNLNVKGNGTGHCQFCTKRKLIKLFSEFSLGLVDFAKSDFFLSMFEPLYRKNALLGNIDIKLADILPYWLASGWYFVFETGR